MGQDFDADMEKMAADETTQKWWDVCKPCHEPLADRAEGERWAEDRRQRTAMRVSDNQV